MAMSWLLGALLVAPVLTDVCHSRHFRNLRGNEDDDYMFYGLTQDCQVFFIRPPQLSLLATLNVNIHNSYCYPNLAQLLLRSNESLLLVFKQAGNRICTLDIPIPRIDMLFGDHLFSYSILNSFSYASCSHSSNNEFNLDPDLSFLDSVYKDVVYFVDGNSAGEVWDVLQFRLTNTGHLQFLDKIPINNYAKHNWNGPDLASEYVLGLDAQRNYLFQRNRFEQNYVYSCAFDMMFRPNRVSVHRANSTGTMYRTWLNSMAADGYLLVFTETDRTIQPPVTRIFGQNLSSYGNQHFCLEITNFALEFGIVRSSSLMKMADNTLPALEDVTKPKATSIMKESKFDTTTIASTRERGSTRRLGTTRKTTLKYGNVIRQTTDVIVTTTRFYTATDSDENEEVYMTTPDITPVTLSTDENEIKMMASEGRVLENTTLDALSQNQTSPANIAKITVSVLVLYRFM